MKRYLRIYKSLLKINLTTLLAYRINLFNSVISSASWGIFSVVSILILTSRTQDIFGWRREDIILITACYGVAIGIFHALFSNNFHRMGRIIFLGQLDSILLKPIDSQFSLSFWMFNFASIVRIAIGLGLAIFLVDNVGYEITLWGVSLFFLLLIIGIATLYSIWFIVCSILVWIPETSNIVEFMFSVSGLSRYPAQMYRNISEILFLLLLPLMFLLTMPVEFLIGRPQWGQAVVVLFCSIIFLFLSRKFWQFALKHYSSAGG